jgi:hypothetical protein
MKTLIITLLVAFIGRPVLWAQDAKTHSRYELFGTVSFNYSNLSTDTIGIPSPVVGSRFSTNTQTLMVRPTFGYFLTDQIEILADIHYTLSYTRIKVVPQTGYQWWSHRPGLALGGSYNFDINPLLRAFVGTRIGASWSRILYATDPPGDYSWGKAEITFPDLFVGGRFYAGKDWALVMLVEYSKTEPYLDLPYGWAKNESTSVAFGFSVFL